MSATLPILCTTACWAPVSYFRAWVATSQGYIEAWEHYSRQTYRNRYLILGANSIIPLTVPVRRAAGNDAPIREVEIDYSTPWQRLHLKTLVSAYRNSPFFEYYLDDLQVFYTERFRLLFDYNLQAFARILGLLRLPTDIRLSAAFGQTDGNAFTDLRDTFHPHSRCSGLPSYEQVFSQKLGFQADLSILDLLFNLGPDAAAYLTENCENF
ncbi:MAG: WbqC family protein [Bacteroidales bacterium]|nr:WbqC family protein [Bacteroidales bacterium]